MAIEKIWVLADVVDGKASSGGLELLTAARGFGSTVDAVVWGQGAASSAAALGSHGAGRVLAVSDLGGGLAGPPVAAALAERINGGEAPDAILASSSYDCRDIIGRLSAKLDRPVISNIVGIEKEGDGLVTQHAIFGGTQIARARFTGQAPGLFIVRPKTFAAEESGGGSAEVVELSAGDLGATGGAKVLDRHVEEREGPTLDEAAVVVSGGRGLGGAEGYAMIEELAKLLNGAAGASRAIVDAGWVPYSHQVGQTGKTVKPTVYIACGISGATQHMVGMKGSKNIVAINKDAEAPIFSIADLGVVGDVHKVLPKLIDAVKAKK
ncbi:MAG TPA: electron transfer flavoprotein subunit alpha/FixB family protein [Acidimicrobiales bacterium]|nr:electron transfer flavoprotein subunit alpha/FixB family protein [Acidimicrobiales bacterium]